MDIEFHYYITYIIARKAGFNAKDSYILAYSSQYADDNNDHLYISEETDQAYESYISQTMDILKPEKELMRIYPVFHFLPGSIEEITGDSARRADGKFHLMNTIPNSQNSRMVMAEAFNTKDLYRIGIATHTYADTFAHQNFVGANDTFNDMSGLLEQFIPSIGHADAKHQPDIPNQLWWDGRLVPEHASINNKDRFLEAVGCIFDLYCGHTGTGNGRDALIHDIGDAIGDSTSTRSQRIKNYKNLIGGELIEYDDKAWFDEAVRLEVKTESQKDSGDTVPQTVTFSVWRDNNGYDKTHWFAFQEAVKEHQEYVLTNIMRPIYKIMGQTIW